MNLRNKIIVTVTFVMLFALMVLLLSVVSISALSEISRKHELASVIRTAAPGIYSKGGQPVLTTYMRCLDFVADWRLVEDQRVVDGPQGDLSPPAGVDFISITLQEQPSRVQLAFIVGSRPIIQRDHAFFLITGLACTAVLVGVLYVLLSRLVIRPVDIVIAASKAAARGVPPGTNPIPGRSDEAGVMVQEFYALLAETFDYRQRLEEKVNEATEEIRKATEQLMLSQRLSAAGKLAAGVAHEINNPLGGMLNAVNKLKKSVTGDKEREYFELLEECIRRIEKLVKELLSFVRKEEQLTAVALNECIDFAQRMAQHALTEKDITFEKELPPSSVVQGNATELQQMFLNLFLNAADSMEKGEGTLRVSAVVQAEKGKLEVRVSDTGCGIPAGELGEVFDLFFTTKEGGKGSGLGLGIVHAIIKHHRGTIELESEEGVGTTVVIGLPLTESEQA